MRRTFRILCVLVLSVPMIEAGALGPRAEFSAKAAPKETPWQSLEKCDTAAPQCQQRISELARPDTDSDKKVIKSPAARKTMSKSTNKPTKRCCIIYQPGHQGDDRYCSQSVPC